MNEETCPACHKKATEYMMKSYPDMICDYCGNAWIAKKKE
jgi:hypothetical protein